MESNKEKLVHSDIREVVAEYNKKRIYEENHRYTSFDYCYNYFWQTENIEKDIEKSCLVLGFYLASWGMFRGSSFLLQKSVKYFEPIIKYISNQDKSVWKIDVDNYNPESMKEIKRIYDGIKELLIKNGNADLTLITKILLGVFGFVPAFDNYFCDNFRIIAGDAKKKCRFRNLDEDSLTVIKDFYKSNKESIDDISKHTFTKDFNGQETKINYPKAKIIDMYGFAARLMKIYAIYAQMEQEPRCYVEAKSSNDLIKIMKERDRKGEPYGMFPGWNPIEVDRKEMIQILNRFNENDIGLVEEDKREEFALFVRMQLDNSSIIEELKKYKLYKQKYSVNR